LNLNGLAPRRLLILSAAVGTGHMRAAEAIELAARQMLPHTYIRNVDILKLASAPFRRCYGGMYVDFIDLAPQVLGFFYNLMDKPCRELPTRWDRIRLFLEKANLRPFLRFMQSDPWDLIINTHFLSAEIVASMRRQGELQTPQVMVTTDFETHHLWVNQPCEHYFTATDEAAEYLHFFGVPGSDTSTVGIPVHPVFAESKDRGGCLARHGLAGDRPIVLQLNGGYGVGPIEDLYRALLDITVPIELVVVAGKNEKARDRLTAIAPPARHRVTLLGFTQQMDELMTVADLVVSKPGGLTISETMAKGAGLVIVHPVPGQEERNSDYLLENGAAIKINHLPTLAHRVSALLREPERLAQLKANSRRLGRPRAAFDVVRLSVNALQKQALALEGGRSLEACGSLQ
jgi:processive 1,2-diacylglycerol beta-glucosyltransferase